MPKNRYFNELQPQQRQLRPFKTDADIPLHELPQIAAVWRMHSLIINSALYDSVGYRFTSNQYPHIE
jgi:hypothetical protein